MRVRLHMPASAKGQNKTLFNNKSLKIMEKKTKKVYNTIPKLENFTSNEVKEHEPFIIVNREGKWLIALTNSIVCNKEFDSYEEAGTYSDSKPWDLIINTVAFAINKLNEK